MWDFLMYALFVVGLIACLRYVMGALETEEPRSTLKRTDRR